MEDRYTRNRLYLTDYEQDSIKGFPILLGGIGIGSVIAECALRFGFETITIIDNDVIEMSNLNRQNYTENAIGMKKTDALAERLLAINKNAKISVYDMYLTTENVSDVIKSHKVAINALDFTSQVPLKFDEVCQSNNIPVLHPYNLGWAGLLTVIMPNGLNLSDLVKPDQKFNEVKMVEYVSGYLKFWGNPQIWIDDIMNAFKKEQINLPPPQLSIASWTIAAMCTQVLFNIATKKKVKQFPDFYLSSILGDLDEPIIGGTSYGL